jgi:hyperosmotically inducible periplasmic protein
MNMLPRATIASLAIAAFALANAQTAADNTRQNSSDPINKAATADMQKNDQEDLALTRQIRASVMADKSLSTYAHNIKIVSINGNVTLNGVVRSQKERDAIEVKTKTIANNGSIINNLKIAP